MKTDLALARMVAANIKKTTPRTLRKPRPIGRLWWWVAGLYASIGAMLLAAIS